MSLIDDLTDRGLEHIHQQGARIVIRTSPVSYRRDILNLAALGSAGSRPPRTQPGSGEAVDRWTDRVTWRLAGRVVQLDLTDPLGAAGPAVSS